MQTHLERQRYIEALVYMYLVAEYEAGVVIVHFRIDVERSTEVDSAKANVALQTKKLIAT